MLEVLLADLALLQLLQESRVVQKLLEVFIVGALWRHKTPSELAPKSHLMTSSHSCPSQCNHGDKINLVRKLNSGLQMKTSSKLQFDRFYDR